MESHRSGQAVSLTHHTFLVVGIDVQKHFIRQVTFNIMKPRSSMKFFCPEMVKFPLSQGCVRFDEIESV